MPEYFIIFDVLEIDPKGSSIVLGGNSQNIFENTFRINCPMCDKQYLLNELFPYGYCVYPNDTINHLNKCWLLTDKQVNILKNIIIDFMIDFFKKNPYSININKELISSQLVIKSDFIDYLLSDLESDKKIEKKNDGWVLFKHQVSLSKREEKLRKMIIAFLEKEKFNTSSIDELLNKCNISDRKLVVNMIKICESQNLLVRINSSIFITASNFIELKEKLKIFFKKNSALTVSNFKDLVDTSRKYAIPILEYLDKIKFTYRDGNERKLLK